MEKDNKVLEAIGAILLLFIIIGGLALIFSGEYFGPYFL